MQLVARQSGGCLPTAEGSALLPYAESLLRINARAFEVVRKKRITLGASSNIGIYLLPPYVKAYVDENAGEAFVDMVIDNNPVIADRLEAGEIDIAAMEWWDDRPGFIARSWRQEHLVAIVAPNHPWADLPHISKAMLRGAPLLGGEPGTGTGRLLARHLGNAADDVRTIMRLDSTEAVKRWVQAGAGVSIVLFSAVAQECRAGTLRAIPLEGKPLTKELLLVTSDSLSPRSAPYRFLERLLKPSAQPSAI